MLSLNPPSWWDSFLRDETQFGRVRNDTRIQFILSKLTYYKFVALENNYKTVPLDRPPVEGNPCRAGDLINIK